VPNSQFWRALEHRIELAHELPRIFAYWRIWHGTDVLICAIPGVVLGGVAVTIPLVRLLAPPWFVRVTKPSARAAAAAVRVSVGALI